ncbi:putative cuticle collagen 91 [Corvus cornix cornix]|uniref:putative cuticle collagen 91 n=1 Tax=Corvus cornix cornix TaxID=932674 RepID=UPI0019506C39|nr:putative cuticle collagen 91 [Corvus cornix cornix]
MCPQLTPLGWLSATPLPRPSGEAGFSLPLLLLLLRLLHLPLRRMPRYPPPVPAHELPSASRGAAGRESPAAPRSAAGATSPRAAQPRIGGSGHSPPTDRLGSARLGSAAPRTPAAGEEAEPAGEAVPGGDSACGRRGCLSLLAGGASVGSGRGSRGAPGAPEPAEGGARPSTCGARLAQSPL